MILFCVYMMLSIMLERHRLQQIETLALGILGKSRKMVRQIIHQRTIHIEEKPLQLCHNRLLCVVIGERLPRQLCILAILENIVRVAHHWEVCQRHLTELSLAVYSLSNTTSHNQRLEGYTSQDIHCLLVSLTLAEQDTNLAGTTTCTFSS